MSVDLPLWQRTPSSNKLSSNYETDIAVRAPSIRPSTVRKTGVFKRFKNKLYNLKDKLTHRNPDKFAYMPASKKGSKRVVKRGSKKGSKLVVKRGSKKGSKRVVKRGSKKGSKRLVKRVVKRGSKKGSKRVKKGSKQRRRISA